MIESMIAAGGALVALVILGVLAIIGLVIYFFVFWILMIVDVARRKFKDDTEKIVWILILVFLNWLGAIIYYFAVKKSNTQRNNK